MIKETNKESYDEKNNRFIVKEVWCSVCGCVWEILVEENNCPYCDREVK